jgi:hypothetical protein
MHSMLFWMQGPAWRLPSASKALPAMHCRLQLVNFLSGLLCFVLLSLPNEPAISSPNGAVPGQFAASHPPARPLDPSTPHQALRYSTLLLSLGLPTPLPRRT